MELNDYIRVIRKRWRVIAASVLLVVGAAALLTAVSPRSYQAQTQLFVSTQAGQDSSALLQGSSFTQQRVKSYADVMTTPKVLDPVIASLGLRTTAAVLAGQITATVPLDTVLIEVSVLDASPRRAAAIADAVGKQFTQTVAELESVTEGKASPVKITVVKPPSVPVGPVSPRPSRNIGLGLVVGLLLGLGLALLRDLLDTSIKAEEDVSGVTGANVLGRIAFDPEAATRPLIVQADPHSPRAEAFRTLRTNLKFVDAANHPRSLVFTSTLPSEGKTTTTANLAITLAASGASVCLVEGDLRRPRLLDYMGLEGSVGLTNVLVGQAKIDDVLQPFADTTVQVIGCGPIPPNPSELLGSDAMIATIRELESRFDLVIVDAPPLLPVTDAAVLSTVADGTVVVIAAGKINREELTRSLSCLDAVQARTVGIVLNMLPARGADAYAYHREGYARVAAPGSGSGLDDRPGPRSEPPGPGTAGWRTTERV